MDAPLKRTGINFQVKLLSLPINVLPSETAGSSTQYWKSATLTGALWFSLQWNQGCRMSSSSIRCQRTHTWGRIIKDQFIFPELWLNLSYVLSVDCLAFNSIGAKAGALQCQWQCQQSPVHAASSHKIHHWNNLSDKVEFGRHMQKLLGGAAAPPLVNILQGIFLTQFIINSFTAWIREMWGLDFSPWLPTVFLLWCLWSSRLVPC